MSEDAAYRRCQAARLVRRLPVLLEKVASGELHLTGLLMLGPHLTEENHTEVLELAKHRSKKEIAKLVRRLDPLPDVPALVEPLGPPPVGGAPTWAEFMDSLCPVRDLQPGERLKDWVPEDTLPSEAPEQHRSEPKSAALAGALHAPQRYKVQFTASEEYVQLLNEARDLLAHSVRNRAVEEVHLRALRLLVRELKKRKYAVSDEQTPRQRGTNGEPKEAEQAPRQRGEDDGAAEREPSRYIPASERRAVWQKDGGRCGYVDERRQRCRETSGLQIHHEQAFAKGGASTRDNLSLRCKAHNDLAAEQDFGKELVLLKKGERPAPVR